MRTITPRTAGSETTGAARTVGTRTAGASAVGTRAARRTVTTETTRRTVAARAAAIVAVTSRTTWASGAAPLGLLGPGQHPAGAEARRAGARLVPTVAGAAETEATFVAPAEGTTGRTRAAGTTGSTTATAGTARAASASGATRPTSAGTARPAPTRSTRATTTRAARTSEATAAAARATGTAAARATGSTATAGATAVSTTAAVTTATAVPATATSVPPAIVAASGRSGTGEQVDGVIEVALLLDTGQLLLALDHAHQAHAVRAAADDLERLHQAGQAISRDLDGRRDGLGDGPGSGRRLGRGFLSRRFGGTSFGLRFCSRLGRAGSVGPGRSLCSGTSLATCAALSGSRVAGAALGCGSFEPSAAFGSSDGLGPSAALGCGSFGPRAALGRSAIGRGAALGSSTVLRGGRSVGGRSLVSAAGATIVGTRRKHGAADLGRLAEQSAGEFGDRLHGDGLAEGNVVVDRCPYVKPDRRCPSRSPMAFHGAPGRGFRNNAAMSALAAQNLSRPTRRVAPLPLRLSRLYLSWALLLGCASRGPAAPSAWDKLREPLLGEVVVPSFERTLAKVDALANKGLSPFKGEDLHGLLFARAGLPPEVVGAIDLSQPIAFVVVRGAVKADPFPAVAFAARPGQADRILQLLGARRPAAGQGASTEAEDGAPTARVNGTVVVVAPTAQALAASADLAEAARRTVAHDVLVAAFPPSIARWQGVEPAKAGEFARNQLLKTYDSEHQGPVSPARKAERVSLAAAVDPMLLPLGETRVVELGLSIDDSRGLSLALRALPVPGTALAKRWAERNPYHADERLLGGTPAIAISSGGSSWLKDYAVALVEQGKAGIKGAGEVGRRFTTVTDHLTGGSTVALRFGAQGPKYEATFIARSPAGAAAALQELSALVASPALGELLTDVYGARAPHVTGKRAEDRLEVQITLGANNGDLRAWLGERVDVVVTTNGERLVLTSDRDGGTLARLLAPKAAAAPSRELADALASTAGADGFGFVDLWSLATPIVQASLGGPERAVVLGILPALGTLKLPVVVSNGGGEAMTAELRLPGLTLSSVTSALRLFGGGNLGGVLTPGP